MATSTNSPSFGAGYDYQVQLALLHQQNKKQAGAAPDPALQTRNAEQKLNGRVSNLFADGSLLGPTSLQKLYRADPTLWADFETHGHMRLPDGYKSGPDLEQCFCGVFCFDSDVLDDHLASYPRDAKVLAGLVDRLDKVGIDPVSRERFLALAMQGVVSQPKSVL